MGVLIDGSLWDECGKESGRLLENYLSCFKNGRSWTRVEAGKSISTVIPASLKRRQKGNPVVSGETVMYGYESSATLTTDRLHYKLQTRPLQRGRPKTKNKAIFRQKKGKSKMWSCALHQDRLTSWPTVSCKVTSTIPVWRRVRILPPYFLRVGRGDRMGTELVSGETVPADLREG
jgi:hypothetical protein